MSPFWLDQKHSMLYSMAWQVLWLMAIHFIGESLPDGIWPLWGPSMVWLIGFWLLQNAMAAIWRVDYMHGALEQWLLDPWVARSMIRKRLVVFSVCHLGSQIMLLPLLAWMFDLSMDACLHIVLGWLAILPLLWWVGATLSALSLGLKDRAALLVLVGFPLYIPGVFLALMWLGGALSFQEGLPWWCILAGGFFTLSPMTIEHALRIGVDR